MVNLLFGGISSIGLLRVVILKLLDDYNLYSEPVISKLLANTNSVSEHNFTASPKQNTMKKHKKVANCNSTVCRDSEV